MEVTGLPCTQPLHLPAEEQHVRDDPDTMLVVAAQHDPMQFVELYERYFRRVHGYVRLRIRDATTAEDVTSQVFMTALARIDSFQREGSFGAWLFRIAQHAVADVYRSRRADQVGDEVFADLPDAGAGPEAIVLAAERSLRLRAVVSARRPEHQHLLALRYGAGLSFAEIGQIVGKTAAAVRVSVHRILEDLRRRYPHDE